LYNIDASQWIHDLNTQLEAPEHEPTGSGKEKGSLVTPLMSYFDRAGSSIQALAAVSSRREEGAKSEESWVLVAESAQGRFHSASVVVRKQAGRSRHVSGGSSGKVSRGIGV